MPIEVPVASFDFRVVDYIYPSAAAKATSLVGELVATFDPVEPPYYWAVDRLFVQTFGNTQEAAVGVFLDPRTNLANYRDVTLRGNSNLADNASPIMVPTGRQLIVVWYPCDVGVGAFANVQARLVQRVSL